MATSELIEALQMLAHERKIDEFYLIERLEESLAKSYQHILDLEWDARVTIDRETGKIYVYELVPVGEPDEETGEYSEFEERDVTPSDVSRIAAQNAKSVISSIVRDAGRQSIYEEFSHRIGDLVTGTVLQGTPDFTIIKIRDGVEAELPHYDKTRSPKELNERPAGERYRHNPRLKVLIIDVRDPSSDEPRQRGEQSRPPIVVSRTHPDLIRRLFEIEVPEIYDGLVEVKSIAREPGIRSKVAVHSREANLDPVGACVGPKGSRVRMVVEELHNERVDVIQWSADPARYVANALSPAKVTSVTRFLPRHVRPSLPLPPTRPPPVVVRSVRKSVRPRLARRHSSRQSSMASIPVWFSTSPSSKSRKVPRLPSSPSFWALALMRLSSACSCSARF